MNKIYAAFIALLIIAAGCGKKKPIKSDADAADTLSVSSQGNI